MNPTPFQTEAELVLNGECVPASQARVSALCTGFQLGHGVYTSLKVEQGRPLFFKEHYARLSADAHALGLEIHKPELLHSRIMLCLSRNRVSSGAMKVLLFKDLNGTGELIHLRAPSPLEKARARGCRLKTVEGPASCGWVARHKASSYLAHLLARQEALSEGFDEALWLSADREALECSGANLFVVYKEELLTPPLSAGILPGIIRGFLLKAFSGAREAHITAEILEGASELFITNSLIGILPVADVDGRIPDVLNGTFTQRAAGLVQASESVG